MVSEANLAYNIMLGWKGLTATKSLAHYGKEYVVSQKIYIKERLA